MSTPLQNSTTIPAFISNLRTAQPAGVALYYRATQDQNWVAVNWTEYYDALLSYAAGLQSVGLQAGERVALMLATHPDWEYLDKAILANRGVVIGLETHAPRAHAERVMTCAQPRILVVETLELLQNLGPELLAGIETIYVRAGIEKHDVPALHPHILPLSALEQAASTFKPPRIAASDLALIIFTSGTTGAPRGLAYSHQQVVSACTAILARFPWIDANDRTVCWLPLANLFQRMINLCAMAAGCGLYMVADPRQLMDGLPSIKPSILIGVPKLYQTIYQRFFERVGAIPYGVGNQLTAVAKAATPKSPAHRLTHYYLATRFRQLFGGEIRCLISGSAPCPEPILAFYERMGVPVLEAYGVSENIVPIALNSLQHCRQGSVGRPLVQNEVRIAADGEIVVRGSGVCRHYLEPSAAPRPDRDDELHTGDAGHFDADGFLHLSGRLSEIVKLSSGRRVNLNQAEQRLLCLNGVEQAVAIAHGHPFVVGLIHCAVTDQDGLARVRDELAAAQTEVPGAERVRGILATSRPFSMERDELTPNLKTKRKNIEDHFAAPLARLLENIGAQPKQENTIVVMMDS